MADNERARGRAKTWPEETQAGSDAAGLDVARLTQPTAQRLASWIAAEVGPGRLMPWMPVAYGVGIALYFAAEREPRVWAPAVLTALLGTIAILVRRRSLAFAIALLATMLAGGFLTATLRTATASHPILRQPSFGIAVSGFVEVTEERERSDRIVVAVHSIQGPRLDQQLERLRVAVRKGTAPPVGSFVSFTARLVPPLLPLRPGGYDFARDLYFQRLGASGFVTGAIKVEAPPRLPTLALRARATIAGWRDGIDARIRSAVGGDAGAIASALITGKRDAISAPVNDAMYVSSLAHVLSISGYHMAVVAGVVFFAVRGLLALSSALALRRPIKKWAAVVALIAAAFYLVLSGAEVATQRAFLMIAIVLVGVLADRRALTMRTLAVAAMAVMTFAPQAVVHPSFQMSFAATLALVAIYERGMPGPSAGRDSSRTARYALWGAREVIALALASLVAGAATTAYAAYHFHRLAPYGVLANLIAMPIVSAVAMPAGLMALVVMPFGFDAPLWRLMGLGIDWMTSVAQWVAALPGAVGRIPAFGTGALLLATAGLVLLGLLRSPLRLSGVVLLALAAYVAGRTPVADVLVASDGLSYAVRGRDGRLQILKGGDSFAAREWLAADGDARAVADPGLARGFSCDGEGCTAALADGTLVAVARTAEAFADDCARAALVLTARTAPPSCAATVIDRDVVRRNGAMALRRERESWRIEPARPPGQDRPWAPATHASRQPDGTTSPRRQAPRDATPRPDEVDADD